MLITKNKRFCFKKKELDEHKKRCELIDEILKQVDKEIERMKNQKGKS